MDATMPAVVQVRKGAIDRAFEQRELPLPALRDNFILIQVEAFGLNYADGMAIKGQYREAPPLPAVLGYDVCGRVVAVGKTVTLHKPGDRVTAMTRFGGYAGYAATDERAAAKITEEMDVCSALSMATQAATAWYCAEEACRIYENDRVLITAAAGGVGSLLLQLCLRRKARVYGIVSSREKEQVVMKMGAYAALNRSAGDIFSQYRALEGDRAIDIMFDSAGGSYIRKGIRQLAPGGRLIGFGAAQSSNSGNIFSMLSFALSFGLFHPAPFLIDSHAFCGVNMLRLADHKPEVVRHCLQHAMALFHEGALKPLPGKVYPVAELVAAHKALASGIIPGKIAIHW